MNKYQGVSSSTYTNRFRSNWKMQLSFLVSFVFQIHKSLSWTLINTFCQSEHSPLTTVEHLTGIGTYSSYFCWLYESDIPETVRKMLVFASPLWWICCNLISLIFLFQFDSLLHAVRFWGDYVFIKSRAHKFIELRSEVRVYFLFEMGFCCLVGSANSRTVSPDWRLITTCFSFI